VGVRQEQSFPTMPDATPAAISVPLPPQLFTLSGVVFEATADGNAPVGDVNLYCDSCGAGDHTFIDSDANGAFCLLACRRVIPQFTFERPATK
jgi:hypothetical protein